MRYVKSVILFFIAVSSLFADSEALFLRKIQAALLLSEYDVACSEAKKGLGSFPASEKLQGLYLQALSFAGREQEAVSMLSASSDRLTLENVSWGVLRKGLASQQYVDRITGLVGAFLTHDAKALPIFLETLKDSNATLRCIALQLACHYRDYPLQRALSSMLREETVWQVRLEVIRSIGQMRLREESHALRKIAESAQASFEEKAAAVVALANIYDSVSLEEIAILSGSKSASLRKLACDLVFRHRFLDAKKAIIRLVNDNISDVQVAAINTFIRCFVDILPKEEILSVLKDPLGSLEPRVAIAAARAALVADYSQSHYLEKYAHDDIPENRRFAAAAIASSGKMGVNLALKLLKSADPYARINAAIGLIGQRKNVTECCDIIYRFLETNYEKIMWDNCSGLEFRSIAPSTVTHNDQMPNYPEAVDQMTRLQLASFLAVLEDARAVSAIKNFLKQKRWGLSGTAAIALLQEGDQHTLDSLRLLLEDPDNDIRLQAALILSMLGKDEAAALTLQKIYHEQDVENKMYIIEALGYAGDDSFFSFFIEVLKEPFEKLRLAGASALIQCLYR